MKRLRRHTDIPRITAHHIERDEPVETVEGRVLNPFGHGRPRGLLETANEFAFHFAG